MLNEGYRQQYRLKLLDAQINDLPNMDAQQRRDFYQQLEWAGTHPSDILKGNTDSSDPQEIKRMLEGK
jgi:hypothetical protein